MYMKSATSHKIKQRTNANDVFITPLGLAKLHIDLIDEKYNNSMWLDPCKNIGSYYDQFPETCKKDYCEILENKDFFDYDSQVNVIVSNPPYSLLDQWIKKSIQLNPDVISYLISQGALTTRRIQIFEKAGYGLIKLHLTKVWQWYGMSYIVIFEKGKESVINYDRTVWR